MTSENTATNENNNLRILALYYNEPMLYIDNTTINHRIPVTINVIGANKNKNQMLDKMSYRDIIIRVSAPRSSNYNHPGYQFEETKWEGKLQDWYQACADVVKNVAGYK